MSEASQQAITHVLQRDSDILAPLLAKVNQLSQLNRLMTLYLDTALAKHCQVASYELNHLVIITELAIWSTQFRFQIPDLLVKLRQHDEFRGLKNIQCKVSPARHEPKVPEAYQEQAMPRLSLESASVVLALAKTIPHEGLSEVMKKIAGYT